MTEVSFHFNVPDRLAYACRLLRKAVRKGVNVVVSGPEARLAQFDRQLWVFEPLEFIPHVYVPAGRPVAPRLAATPVWLVGRVETAPHHDVLVSLGDELVDGFERFARVIELVTADGADRQAARTRWKHYADRGYAITRHDVAAEPA